MLLTTENVSKIASKTVFTSGIWGIIWLNSFARKNNYYGENIALFLIWSFFAYVSLFFLVHVFDIENILGFSTFAISFFSLLFVIVAIYALMVFVAIRVTLDLNHYVEDENLKLVEKRNPVLVAILTITAFLSASYLQSYVNDILKEYE